MIDRFGWWTRLAKAQVARVNVDTTKGEKRGGNPDRVLADFGMRLASLKWGQTEKR